ncbi:LPS export ABC transporter periplasmic protein LptC [Solimonas sp. K1W22B-7]|uniref:LPS export ABC transporter periplasmic protein LptC n=1 Tax=Solimonas sp. K1W22B-7 TaxID=2303331 RepID=UPI000E333251|nr:LPS export ABC transporter periplasmic protein LptC [Solimonas sp. K1W22B-7]AXQ28027.1 LPS export ABC transporter periplasmic protein LptC [Solimonas sp. K1W22B-7]
MKRGSLFFVVAAALAVFATLTLLRGFQPETQQAVAETGMPPRYELQGVQWTRLDAQGKPLIQAAADTARYYDDKSARFEMLSVQRLGEGGGPWNLQSPSGRMPAGQQRIVLDKPVEMTGRMKSGEPVRVDTDSLWVDLERKEIATDDRVRLSGPNRAARARGMRADWGGTQVKLLNEVEVDYVPQPRS